MNDSLNPVAHLGSLNADGTWEIQKLRQENADLRAAKEEYFQLNMKLTNENEELRRLSVAEKMDSRSSPDSTTLLTEIIDYFATKQEGLGDMWAHPDDFSSYGLDYRNRDGSQLWIDLDKDGRITVLWKPVGQEKPSILKFTATGGNAQAATTQVRHQEKRWVVKMSWQDGETPASCQMDETGSLEDAKAKVRHYAVAVGWKPEMGAKFEVGSYDWPHYVTAAPTALRSDAAGGVTEAARATDPKEIAHLICSNIRADIDPREADKAAVAIVSSLAKDAAPTAWRVWWVSLNTARTEIFEDHAKATAKAHETGGCVIPLFTALAQPLAAEARRPDAWQARNLKGGIWQHCDYPHSNSDFEYRPLYADAAQATKKKT